VILEAYFSFLGSQIDKKRSTLACPEWDFFYAIPLRLRQLCKINTFNTICADPSGRAV
jgi:hypothetical protein